MKHYSKHTPGPWLLERGEYLETESYTEYADEVIHIPALDISLVSENAERNLANARLIAAAPEMLEALERLMGHLQSEKIISTERVEINAIAWQIYGLISRVRGE